MDRKIDPYFEEMKSLMEASEEDVIFLDDEACVQRYTPTATNIFHFKKSDEGRPFDHIKHSLEYENLMDDVNEVMKTREKVKKLVCTDTDRWFIMRVCPYRTEREKKEGVMLSFTEFTELTEAKSIIRQQNFQESLAELGIYALEQNDIQTVLKRAIEIACINLELDCAVIYNFDEDGNTFSINEQAGCAEEGDPLAVDSKWDAGYALNNMDEPTVVHRYDEEDRFSISPYMKGQEIVSSVHLPVRGSEKTYGLMALYVREHREFTEQEMYFLKVLANIVGMAIQQKKDRERLRQETERSLQYQKEIVNSSVKERWELGGYLHDNLGQLLASAKILIDGMQRKLSRNNTEVEKDLREVQKIIDEGIDSIRDLTHDIIPIDLEAEGVRHAFKYLVRQTEKMYDVNCKLEMDGVVSKVKNRKLATHLYYISQEAVKNAAMHGQANNIEILVEEQDDQLKITIKDDGIGLAEESENNGNGKGIRIMKHRMELLGGTCTVDKLSDNGETGTCVTCSVEMESVTAENGSS